MIYNLTAKINNSDRKFIDKFHSFSVNSSMNENISGGATRPFLRESILAGVGEYFERDAVFAFNRNFANKERVGCLNLLTKKVNYFDICNEKYKIYFSDTCGCACHTNSDNLVNNCFSEFVERQSFMLRYLSKTAMYKLKFDKNLFEKLIPSELRHLKFYNISLVDSYFVILCIGTLNNDFYIGLGADFNLLNAIKNCIKEVMQMSSFYTNKNKNDNKNFKNRDREFKDYIDYFMELDSKRLENAYLFLDRFEEKAVDKNLLYNCYDINDTLSELYDKYKIEPYLFFMENMYNFKIAKIVDFNWFPTLLPKTISEEKIKNIEKITGLTIDRKCNFIPFP